MQTAEADLCVRTCVRSGLTPNLTLPLTLLLTLPLTLLLGGCREPLTGEWELHMIGDDLFPIQGGASACSQTWHFSLLIQDDLTGKLIPVTRSRITSSSTPMNRLALPVTVEVRTRQARYTLKVQDSDTSLTLDCALQDDALDCTTPEGELWAFRHAIPMQGGPRP